MAAVIKGEFIRLRKTLGIGDVFRHHDNRTLYGAVYGMLYGGYHTHKDYPNCVYVRTSTIHVFTTRAESEILWTGWSDIAWLL